MSSDRRMAWVLVAVYLASRAALVAAGVGLSGYPGVDRFYQVLSQEILRDDLLRGLVALHYQPPLFNLLVGLALKSPSPTSAFAVELLAAGITIVLAIFFTLRTLGIPRAAAAIAATLYILNPTLIGINRTVFYTIFEIALLSAGGCALLVAGRRVIDRAPSLAAFIAYAGCLSALVALRPFYHPLWAALLGVSAMVWLKRIAAPLPRGVTWLIWSPVIFGLAIMGKNLWLIGEPVTGTLMGQSLARTVFTYANPAHAADLARQGVLSSIHTSATWLPLSSYEDWRYDYAADVPTSSFTHPALSTPLKANGQPNFNHLDYVGLSHALTRNSLAYIARYPSEYAAGVYYNVRRFSAPATYDTNSITGSPLLAWAMSWTAHRALLHVWMWMTSGSILLLLIGGAMRLRRAWAGEARALAEAPAVSLALISTVWVATLGTLIDYGESDRYRAPLDPFLWAACVCLLFHLRNRQRGVSAVLLEE